MDPWHTPNDGCPGSPPHLDLVGEHGRARGHSGEDPAAPRPPHRRTPHGELFSSSQHCVAAASLLPTLGGALSESPDGAALGKPLQK
jgi:hypothetical protein